MGPMPVTVLNVLRTRILMATGIAPAIHTGAALIVQPSPARADQSAMAALALITATVFHVSHMRIKTSRMSVPVMITGVVMTALPTSACVILRVMDAMVVTLMTVITA
jgi:hypothetical protein